MSDKKVIASVLKSLESEVDDAINKLDCLTDQDLEKIRKERLAQMKKETEQKHKWLSLGHGEYNEIAETDFFPTAKASSRAIFHFYKRDAPRCLILDNHLNIIAKKHLEARIVKLDAEKSLFLTGRLNITIIPTVLVTIDNIVKDKIVGFTELGNCDDFSTETLEWRLGVSQALHYEGDLDVAPFLTKKEKSTKRVPKSTISGRENDSSDSD